MRRAAALGAIAGLWIVLLAPSAAAHAVLVSSDPANGSRLESPPSEVVVRFSETPDAGLSTIRILDSTGSEVEASDPERVPGDSLGLRVDVSDLRQGVYTVSWRVLSSVDGHVTAGSFVFGVGEDPGSAAVPEAGGTQETPPPSPLGVAGRWGIYVSLSLLLGGAVFGTVVARSRPSVSSAVLVGAWLTGAVAWFALAWSQRSKVGVSLGDLLASDTGEHLVALALAIAVVGVAVGTAVIVPRWTSLPALGLAAAAAMLVHVLGGHAGAPSSIRTINLAVQWFHVAAVGVWVGGLAWLLVYLRGAAPQERGPVTRRFSTLAGVALAIVAATGLLRVLDEVGGPAEWTRLVTTAFGVAVAVKVALFAGLVALGARNRYVNVPGLVGDARRVSPLRRAVTAELAIAVGVFGATGVLTELPPAKVADRSGGSQQAAPVTVEGSDFATTTRVSLTIDPGALGTNRFEATVTDFDTGEPVDARRVSLGFQLADRPDVAASTLHLASRGEGLWSATGPNLSLAGIWQVSALVESASDSVQVDLVVQPRPPPEDIERIEAEGQPTLYTIRLSGGTSVQGYVDPGTAGPNQVHFTFFGPDGGELPVEDPEVDAYLMTGALADLEFVPFSPGHFAAQGQLDAGPWRFTVRATTEGGDLLTAYFEEDIEG